jgi:hypothetical protein
MPWQDLDGNVAFHAGLVCLVNGCHAAFTKRGNDLIMSELFSGQIFHALHPARNIWYCAALAVFMRI